MFKTECSLDTHTHCIPRLFIFPSSYRFLLVFERAPELLELSGDRRAGKLQGFDDISSIANLTLRDEGVGVTLGGDTRCRARKD